MSPSSPVLFAKLVDRFAQALAGAELELTDPDVSVSRLERAAAHARDVDHVARDGNSDGAIHALAHDGEDDVRAGLPAHHLHRVGQRHSLHRGVVQPDDQVARLDAGALGRRVVDRRDDLDEPVLHADLDPQSPEFAAGARLQLLVVVGNEVGGVRIESGQHPSNRVLEQGLVLDGLDVIVLDLGEYLRERAEILERQRAVAAALREHALPDGKGPADRDADDEPDDRSCEQLHGSSPIRARDFGCDRGARILAAAKGLQARMPRARRTIAGDSPGGPLAESRSTGP